jgi:hypothetical protein
MADMKVITKILALALAASSIISLAACSATSQKTGTSANWDERVISNDLQDNSVWFTKKEVATYSVKFTEGSNASYTLHYNTDGAQYSTEFYAIKYDWSSSSIPESFRASETSIENVYVYTTSLTISGYYTLVGGTEQAAFEDSIQTVSYLRAAKNNLEPVYSKQIVKSTSPASYVVNSLENAYVKLDAVYETFYNKGATSAIVKTIDNTSSDKVDDKVVAIDSTYSVFDTNYLPLAIRSFTISSGSTNTFNVLSPITGTTATYTVSGSASSTLVETSEDDKQIIDALNNSEPAQYIYANTDENGVDYYECNAATLTLVADMPGPSYSYYYATVPNNSFNNARSILLKITSPVYFSLGTLTYVLSSVNQVTI